MLYKAECDHCGYSQKLSDDGLRSYQLPGDVRVTIRHQFAWCRACGIVVVAERLLTRGEFTKELADLDEVANDRPDLLGRTMEEVQEAIERQRNRLLALMQIAEHRRSLERCLECGSTSILPIPEIYDEDELEGNDFRVIEHPECGGVLTLRGIGLSNNRTWTFYTTEGEKIQRYEVFPSKGLVPMREHNRDE